MMRLLRARDALRARPDLRLTGLGERYPISVALVFAGLAVASFHAGLRMTAVALTLLCITCLLADPEAPDAAAASLQEEGAPSAVRYRLEFLRLAYRESFLPLISRVTQYAVWLHGQLNPQTAPKGTGRE
mmetsp:Transcript_5668/g.17667  ORF Transcript_5668/g.17667 Transcript_5668/m.17667 type:complete len:130 (+) Transcript_5668:44-433(+)